MNDSMLLQRERKREKIDTEKIDLIWKKRKRTKWNTTKDEKCFDDFPLWTPIGSSFIWWIFTNKFNNFIFLLQYFSLWHCFSQFNNRSTINPIQLCAFYRTLWFSMGLCSGSLKLWLTERREREREKIEFDIYFNLMKRWIIPNFQKESWWLCFELFCWCEFVLQQPFLLSSFHSFCNTNQQPSSHLLTSYCHIIFSSFPRYETHLFHFVCCVDFDLSSCWGQWSQKEEEKNLFFFIFIGILSSFF